MNRHVNRFRKRALGGVVEEHAEFELIAGGDVGDDQSNRSGIDRLNFLNRQFIMTCLAGITDGELVGTVTL